MLRGVENLYCTIRGINGSIGGGTDVHIEAFAYIAINCDVKKHKGFRLSSGNRVRDVLRVTFILSNKINWNFYLKKSKTVKKITISFMKSMNIVYILFCHKVCLAMIGKRI